MINDLFTFRRSYDLDGLVGIYIGVTLKKDIGEFPKNEFFDIAEVDFDLGELCLWLDGEEYVYDLELSVMQFCE